MSEFTSTLTEAYDVTKEKSRINHITNDMVCAKGAYPDLTCKASESRHLVKAMLVILRKPGVNN